MEWPIGLRKTHVLLLMVTISPFLILHQQPQPTARAGTVYTNCLRNTTSASSLTSSAFKTNLDSALERLTALAGSRRYSTASAGDDANGGGAGAAAFALFQCRGDQTINTGEGSSSSSCQECVRNATASLQAACPSSVGARIQLDPCFVRYDNTSDFYTASPPDFSYVIGYCYAKSSDPVALQAIQELMEDVVSRAPAQGGYASANASGEWALAQCQGYLNQTECASCLTTTSYRVVCDSTLGEQLHLASCYFRYEPYAFFTPSPSELRLEVFPALVPIPSLINTSAGAIPTPAPSPRNNSPSMSSSPAMLPRNDSRSMSSSPTTSPPAGGKLQGHKIASIVAGIVGSFIVVASLVAMVIYCRHRNYTSVKTDMHNDILRPKYVVFSFHQLEVATRGFHPDNKLGEGGYGPVYKGALPNGEQVAVKKLASSSQQGKNEFMNEVNIISNVQHKNLIKLRGICMEGSDKMLVYEYLPNKSVDKVLFGDSMEQGILKLDWPTRVGIILGMARGLAYLHDECQVCIIHRDIKLSNILLDDHLHPVIADFGLARVLPEDKSCINTRVAGTLGYLAPEYAIHGELSEKVDVFSFGVASLEVITGRRNFNGGLLDLVWKMFQQRRQLELVDPDLRSSFFAGEFLRIVHVALLCTQATPTLRPTMETITMMLSGESDILQLPTKPAFVDLTINHSSSSAS